MSTLLHGVRRKHAIACPILLSLLCSQAWSEEVPCQLVDRIHIKSHQGHYSWLCSELAVVAIAKKDYRCAQEALRRIDDRGARLNAMRTIAESLATVQMGEELIATTTLIEDWRILGEEHGQNTDFTASVVNALIRLGRLQLAGDLVKERGGPVPIALLIHNGNIAEAVRAAHALLGANDVEGAAELATAAAANGTLRPIAFLREGWPTHQHEWSIRVSLDLSASKLNPSSVIECCHSSLRRGALQNACAELADWPRRFRQSVQSTKLRESAEQLQVGDNLSFALLIAACTQQNAPLPASVEPLLAKTLEQSTMKRPHSGAAQWERGALLSELTYYRLARKDVSHFMNDTELSRKSAGLVPLLISVRDGALLRALDAGTVETMKVAEMCSDDDLRLAIELGCLCAESGLPPRLPPMEMHLREKRRDHLIGVLTDSVLN